MTLVSITEIKPLNCHNCIELYYKAKGIHYVNILSLSKTDDIIIKQCAV